MIHSSICVHLSHKRRMVHSSICVHLSHKRRMIHSSICVHLSHKRLPYRRKPYSLPQQKLFLPDHQEWWSLSRQYMHTKTTMVKTTLFLLFVTIYLRLRNLNNTSIIPPRISKKTKHVQGI